MTTSTPTLQKPKQLELFALDVAPQAQTPAFITENLSTREKLKLLLRSGLDFHGENSGYASHDLHAFAAKFPPQLPLAFIRALTTAGDIVFDPMMGSGTTIVETLLEGRQAIGTDIDPLALTLCRVKTTPLDTKVLREIGNEIVAKAKETLANVSILDQELSGRFDKKTKEFIDYWFLPATQRELMALLIQIEKVSSVSIKQFLELTFSSIIITKSGGVSLARDLAHTRPHRVTKTPKNAIEQFSTRLRKNIASISELSSNDLPSSLIEANAGTLPLKDNLVDLIVTSPPYANAIDYMRAHKFSLVWFGRKVNDLSELRAKYIGSERMKGKELPVFGSQTEKIIKQLECVDKKKAQILRKYFGEMQAVFSEMYRVLKPNAAAIIVVGTSTMRNIDVQTHNCLANISSDVGFEVVGLAPRTLDRNKRMMPARFGQKSDSIIEQRMHEEYVIALLKPTKE